MLFDMGNVDDAPIEFIMFRQVKNDQWTLRRGEADAKSDR